MKTGVLEIKDTYQINIDNLFKTKKVEYGCKRSASLGFGMMIEEVYHHQFDIRCDSYLNVTQIEKEEYQNSIFLFSNSSKVVQQVKVVFVPSNLGKGFNRYFVCPQTKKKCKKIYLNQKHNLWLSRFGFKEIGERLYYPSQAISKFHRVYHQFSNNDQKEFFPKNMKRTYKGRITRKLERTVRRFERYSHQDELSKIRNWEQQIKYFETDINRGICSDDDKVMHHFLTKKVNEHYMINKLINEYRNK